MAFCNKGIEIIDRNECIGNSLSKINNNFVILDSTLCSLTGVTAGVGQIVAGSNITISPSSGTGVVTISGSAGVTGQEVLSADNAGTFGSRVFKEKVNQGLIFRRIASGSTNVTITEEDNTIRISAATSGGGEANVAANVGTGFGLALPKVGTFLPFKSLAAGTGINLLSSINSVVIQTSGENIGTGTGEILKNTTGATPLSLRRITAGANTTVSTIGDDVIIASSSATTGANIGTGTGAVLAGKLGDSFQFKTLKAGTNVEIINNPNDVQINATGGGGGSQLIISDFPPQSVSPGQLWFDSSSGVTSVYYNSTWVDVGGGDSTGGGGDTTASNLGTVAEGVGLFTAKSGSDLPFKRIRAGSNVTITEGTNSITINAAGGGSTGEANTASNIGTGEGNVFAAKSGSDLQFKKIKAGSGVTITDGATDITIDAAGGGGGVPTGAVMYFASTSAPTGWFECNGTALTVALGSTFTNIRNFLIAGGSPFGVSGSDPKVPDLRGKFIRSNGTDGTYSSGTFGSIQADQFKSHTHSYNYTNTDAAKGGGGPNWSRIPAWPVGAFTTAAGGDETRPVNVALLACIKL